MVCKTSFILVNIITCLVGSRADIPIDLNDDERHIIDSSNPVTESLYLDRRIDKGSGTHADLVDGGYVNYSIFLFDNSSLNIKGGSVGHFVSMSGNSRLNISGGKIGEWVTVSNNAYLLMSGGSIGGSIEAIFGSTVYLTGGTVGKLLRASSRSRVTMSGGSVRGYLKAEYDAVIDIYGSDFYVDGVKLSDGEGLLKYGKLNTDETGNYYGGHIIGTLADGSKLSNDCRIYLGNSNKTNIFVHFGSPEIKAQPKSKDNIFSMRLDEWTFLVFVGPFVLIFIYHIIKSLKIGKITFSYLKDKKGVFI